MQSLLSAVLVILIIFVLLIIFVPAWLERRARAHAVLREQFAADIQAQERAARRLELSLSPYARGRSAHFVARVDAARERLASVRVLVGDAAATLDALRLPVVYKYLLPVQHFALVPRDAGAILADTRAVRRLRGQLTAVAAAAAAAEAAVGELTALPQTLAEERRALAAQLDGVDATLRAERAAGIERLSDLEGELNRLRALLARQQTCGDGPPAMLDDGAAALEEAAPGATALAGQVAEVAAARVRLDERLRAVATDLDDIQAGAKATPAAAPSQVRSPLRRAAALLNESAAEHRRARDFAAAEADIAAAARLVVLARDAAAAAAHGRLLADRDDGVSLAAPIADLRRELGELLDGLENRLGSASREATLVARAGDIRRRAEALLSRQDEVIAALDRDASAVQARLAHGWEAARQLLPLAADDPLARRYAALAAATDEARRSPTALEAYRRDAAAFEAEMAPWVTRVQAGRQLVAELRARLPQQIDAAIQLAAPWACLQEHVAFIHQRALDFESAQSQLARASRRREAEPPLDELADIDSQVAERMTLLGYQADRLRFLETGLGEIIALAEADSEGLPPDDPALVRRNKAIRLIAQYSKQAHAAQKYEDASLALSRAADVANRAAL
ncbi:MAG TPA: hypothetical protein PK829_11645 [Promineifilum sp.]|nr:hypothetical protein [Promineifilum sp.]